MLSSNTLALIRRSFCAVVAFIAATNHSSAEEVVPGDWLRALPGWKYAFPADHAVHPNFKTEWWYFTGNLQSEVGNEYGYELTFFRQGVLPPGQRNESSAVNRTRSRFVQNDFKFAHFAISDLARKRFHYTQKLSRGAFGEAGFSVMESNGKPFVWLEDWTLSVQPDSSWHIQARGGEDEKMKVDLVVSSRKPPAIEGTDGISQKSDGLGNASHYYSLTRLDTKGTLAVGDSSSAQNVRGTSWFDHEWASNQLGSDQIGWNWFCIQFDDQTEVMLYAMRRTDGSVDPVSSGTYIDANGATTHLKREDFSLRPLKTWHSAKTGATYPLAWQVAIPSRGIDVKLTPRLDDQELALPQISYWEGAIAIEGQRAGKRLTGQGYMELTGYAGQLSGLKQSSPRDEAGLRNLSR